ncbi:MAG: hypothetical protein ACXAB5_01990, partial [Candidatus Thorarchaeota archaeon]
MPYADEAKPVSCSKQEKSWFWIRTSWISGTIIAGIYLILVYLLPLVGLTDQPQIPQKMFIEVIICAIPLLTGSLLSIQKMQVQKPVVSVSGAVYLDDDGKPKYNESMLLAMRAGMNKSISMAFEAGVFEGEPYLRIFITTTGQTVR